MENRKTGKPVEHASITSWLEKPKGVGSNFAKNLRADCALPRDASTELAEILVNATTDEFGNKFSTWADSHRLSGAECPDLADPLLARVVSEHSLNASFTSNGQKELSKDEKKSSLAIEQRLRRMKKYPHRDKQCSVWST